MKQLFKIAQEQTFQVKIKRNKFEDGYCIRKAKYIYCENEDVAIQSYTTRYGLNTDNNITSSWGNWMRCSDNVRVTYPYDYSECKCSIVRIELLGTETIDEIKNNMFGVEFKEWWNGK